jgi:hypothetical protein
LAGSAGSKVQSGVRTGGGLPPAEELAAALSGGVGAGRSVEVGSLVFPHAGVARRDPRRRVAGSFMAGVF